MIQDGPDLSASTTQSLPLTNVEVLSSCKYSFKVSCWVLAYFFIFTKDTPMLPSSYLAAIWKYLCFTELCYLHSSCFKVFFIFVY